MKRFHKEMRASDHAGRVRADWLGGMRSGVHGTPTWFINGERYRGLFELTSLVADLRPGATVDNRVDLFKSGPTAEWFNVVYAKAHENGGHFGPWENPDAFIEGIRETFAILLGKSPFSVRAGVVPVSDAAGEVEAVGPDVSTLEVGDRVVSRFFPTWYGGPRIPNPLALQGRHWPCTYRAPQSWPRRLRKPPERGKREGPGGSQRNPVLPANFYAARLAPNPVLYHLPTVETSAAGPRGFVPGSAAPSRWTRGDLTTVLSQSYSSHE